MLLFPSKHSTNRLQLFLSNRRSLSSFFDRALKTEQRSYYEVLGVDTKASASEIKEAFYKKSKELHPDNSQSASACSDFVELKKAYDVLRRPADRTAYDNRGRKDYHNMYSGPRSGYQYGPQYDFSNDWRQFWRETDRANFKDSEYKKKSDEQWKIILKWTALGLALVVLYNLGYVFQIYYRDHQLSKLKDEDEITKSFLRQSEFRGKDIDDVEKMSLARMLKADVDEAWRRRREEMGTRNKDEIREEYRWLKAVQDVDHNRRIKAKRAEFRRKELEERWRKHEKPPEEL